MSSTLKKTLSEWTTGLTENEARKKIFTNVRDIEYEIIPGQFTPPANLTQVLLDRKGFCLSKHYLLGQMFCELGYEVKYSTYSFLWKDAGIEFPEDVFLAAQKLPITFHVAIKVLIEHKWILVDVTWDKTLKKYGFTVNDWDGVSEIKLAVKSVKEFEHDDIDAHHIFYQKKMNEYTLKEKVLLARFTNLFNNWLGSIRNEG